MSAMFRILYLFTTVIILPIIIITPVIAAPPYDYGNWSPSGGAIIPPVNSPCYNNVPVLMPFDPGTGTPWFGGTIVIDPGPAPTIDLQIPPAPDFFTHRPWHILDISEVIGPQGINIIHNGGASYLFNPDPGQIFLAPMQAGDWTLHWDVLSVEGDFGRGAQLIQIRPRVNLGPPAAGMEGSTLYFPVFLTAPSPVDSLTVPIVFAGTAQENVDFLAPSQVTFSKESTAATLVIKLLSNDTPVEDKVIELAFGNMQDTGISAGFFDKTHITILDENAAAKLLVKPLMFQQGNATRKILRGGGEVLLRASVRANGINTGNATTLLYPYSEFNFSYSWNQPAGQSIDVGLNTCSFIKFSADQLEPGIYGFDLDVSAINRSELSTTLHIPVEVIDDAGTGRYDINGDGILDDIRDLYDEDFDGVPDYKDHVAETNFMQADTGNQYMDYATSSSVATDTISWSTSRYQADFSIYDAIESHPQSQLTLGNHAIAQNMSSPRFSADEFSASSMPTLGGDSTFIDVIDINLDMQNQTIDSALVVMPLSSVITENSPVKILHLDSTANWTAIDTETGDSLTYSPRTSTGLCPPPGSPDYAASAAPSFSCVQISIKDGGINDPDLTKNGIVPLTVAVTVATSNAADAAADETAGKDLTTNSEKNNTGKTSGGGVLLFYLIPLLLMLLFKSRERLREPGACWEDWRHNG